MFPFFMALILAETHDDVHQATDMDHNYRRRIEACQIKSYFYGGPALSQGQLSPFTIVVKFEDLAIYRTGDGTSSHLVNPFFLPFHVTQQEEKEAPEMNQILLQQRLWFHLRLCHLAPSDLSNPQR